MDDLDKTEKMIILYGIASALDYLHKTNCFFFNLNSTMIFLNKFHEPILDSYGLSCFAPKINEVPFVAPELLRKGFPNLYEIDIFAFGYFMVEVITGIRPILLRKTSERYLYSFPNDLPSNLQPVILKCINPDPEFRITFEDVMSCIYDAAFQDIKVNFKEFSIYAAKVSVTRNIIPDVISYVYKYPFQKELSPHVPDIEIPRIRFRFHQKPESARPPNVAPLSAVRRPLPSNSLPLLPLRSIQMQMITRNEIPDLANLNLEELEKSGDSHSHYILGYYHETEHEYEKAYFHYKISITKKHINSFYRLGLLLMNGFGCKRNIKKASNLFLKAAKNRHSDAAFYYCLLNASSDCLKNDDIKQCMHYIEYSAEVGIVDSISRLAYLVENGICFKKDSSRAFNLYKRAAIRGDAESQYRTAMMLIDGIGTTRAFSDATLFLQKAAHNGHIDALFECAKMFENGIGAQKNMAKSAEFYREAAAKGHPAAKRCYAKIIQEGNYFCKNEKLAFMLMAESVDLGDIKALTELGEMYYYGRGTEKNMKEAFKCFQKAAKLNEPRANVNLGLMYEQGFGTNAETKECANCFKKAAELRDPLGQFHFARVLENGIGVTQDTQSAAVFYRMAANQGFSRAQYNIACYLENGIGIEKDKSLAIQYYKCASKQGIKAAENAIRRLLPNSMYVK